MPTKNRVKVDLFGQDHRTTEVTPQGFPTRHVSRPAPERTAPAEQTSTESAAITPNPPTPAEQVKAVLPAFNKAYKENRTRLIAYLTAGFHNNMSEGVALHELGTALETTYAPRKAMTPAQWKALTADLQIQDFESVDWIASLQTRISRKYEDLRPPTPFTEPQGDIKVYLLDADDGELLIYAYPDELPDNYEYVWKRYVRKYNCTVRIETPTASPITISNEPAEQTEVA